MEHPDLAAERVDYRRDHLVEEQLPAHWLSLFDRWMDEAFALKDGGTLPEPTAMVVSTVADGRPSSRTVLAKQADADGFVFFTNYDSRKGRELTADPLVALLFGWYPLQRQVRVEGTAERLPRPESEAYFAGRPRGSQLGAWASAQSTEVTLAQLDACYAAAEERFAGRVVPCPEYWGGIRVRPSSVEFWQGRPGRMHDRLCYRLTGDMWQVSRLAP